MQNETSRQETELLDELLALSISGRVGPERDLSASEVAAFVEMHKSAKRDWDLLTALIICRCLHDQVSKRRSASLANEAADLAEILDIDPIDLLASYLNDTDSLPLPDDVSV